MTKDIVIELQHLGDSTPHNQGRSTIYAAISEIERLRTALQLAVGELSTHDTYRLCSPDQLYQQFLEEVRCG